MSGWEISSLFYPYGNLMFQIEYFSVSRWNFFQKKINFNLIDLLYFNYWFLQNFIFQFKSRYLSLLRYIIGVWFIRFNSKSCAAWLFRGRSNGWFHFLSFWLGYLFRFFNWALLFLLSSFSFSSRLLRSRQNSWLSLGAWLTLTKDLLATENKQM